MSDQIQATIREADCNIMLFIAGVSVGHEQQEVPGEELQEEKKWKGSDKKEETLFPLPWIFMAQPFCNKLWAAMNKPSNLLPNGNKSPWTPTHL